MDTDDEDRSYSRRRGGGTSAAKARRPPPLPTTHFTSKLPSQVHSHGDSPSPFANIPGRTVSAVISSSVNAKGRRGGGAAGKNFAAKGNGPEKRMKRSFFGGPPPLEGWESGGTATPVGNGS